MLEQSKHNITDLEAGILSSPTRMLDVATNASYNGKIVLDIMTENNMIQIKVKEHTHGVENRARV